MTDIRRIDKITSQKKLDNRELYSDFFVDLNPHPETGMLMRNLNENAVKRSLRNLILTNRGEVPFQPNKGSSIRKILFEQISDVTTDLLTTYIKETVKLEPRCQLLDALVVPNEVNHSYTVSIIFTLVNSNKEVVLNLNLQRIR